MWALAHASAAIMKQKKHLTVAKVSGINRPKVASKKISVKRSVSNSNGANLNALKPISFKKKNVPLCLSAVRCSYQLV